MSSSQIFTELGGGLSAVVIFVLGGTVIILAKWWKQSVDQRVLDAQKNAKAHADTTKEVVEGLNGATVAINAATETIRELRAEVRDLGR